MQDIDVDILLPLILLLRSVHLHNVLSLLLVKVLETPLKKPTTKLSRKRMIKYLKAVAINIMDKHGVDKVIKNRFFTVKII